MTARVRPPMQQLAAHMKDTLSAATLLTSGVGDWLRICWLKAAFHYSSKLQTWFSTRFAAKFSTSSCWFATCFWHAFDFFCQKPGRKPAASISMCRDWCCSFTAGLLVCAHARQMECRKNPFWASKRTCWSWIFVTYFIIHAYVMT